MCSPRAYTANASKSLFLANVSHEIRTPLNGVLGFAQLGYRDLTASTAVRENFARIVDSGKLLLVILNDVLDMSKIEAEKLLLDEAPTFLRPLIQRPMDLVRDAADAKGIALRLTVHKAVPDDVVIDTLRFEQVLLNLLSNAVKFTETGEVQVTVDVVDCHLTVEVRDTGLGMSEEQISRLFTSFEQADRSTTRRYGGTGLGLAISKRLVELMRGTVSVASRLGGGSVFTVRLPLKLVDCGRSERMPGANAALSPSEADHRLSPQRLAGLRVLVAEDEPVNQIVIQSLLASEGARVEIASDGYQAIDRVSASRVPAYDVVLLDVMMPGIDGYETARRIRVIAPTLPIIGQTAHAGMEDLALCFQAGMVDRIVKPLIADDIVRAILECLANHEGRALSLN